MREKPWLNDAMHKKQTATEELGAVDTGPERKWRHIGNVRPSWTPKVVPGTAVQALCGEAFTARSTKPLDDILRATNLCPDCKRIALARYGGGPA